MKTMILYRSKHHGNTKKLVDAILEAHPDVEAIDVATLGKNEYPDLSDYALIGVASGIYHSNIDRDLARVLSNVLHDGHIVFALLTYGGSSKWYGKDIDGICRMKRATFLTSYGCLGFDTWGPFKFTGGMQKGHPTAEEVQGAVDHFDRLLNEYGEIIEKQFEDYKKRAAFAAAHPAGGLMSNIRRSVKKISRKVRSHGDAPVSEGSAAAGDAADPTEER
ncbi:MAG: hypothetical protein SOU51_05685 [Collinsella sp.]|nr:hypothetical protein [Collinsella sp.]